MRSTSGEGAAVTGCNKPFRKKKTVICLPTKHLGDLKNLFKCVRAIKIKFEFGNVGF